MSYARKTYVFAYGTLRPGCGNDRMLGNYHHVGQATARGRLYYHECGAFPVYRPTTDHDYRGVEWVHGDVMLADDRMVADVTAMEVFAGYNAEWMDVRLDTGEALECLTYPWRRKVYDDLLIDNGDWTTTPGAYVLPRREQA